MQTAFINRPSSPLPQIFRFFPTCSRIAAEKQGNIKHLIGITQDGSIGKDLLKQRFIFPIGSSARDFHQEGEGRWQTDTPERF
jgi:hypothetical protein